MFFKVTRSREVQTEMSCLAREIHVLRFFVKDAKIALEHYLNGPNRTKFDNRENIEIPGNSVRSGVF